MTLDGMIEDGRVTLRRVAAPNSAVHIIAQERFKIGEGRNTKFPGWALCGKMYQNGMVPASRPRFNERSCAHCCEQFAALKAAIELASAT